jgi:hypothetical protein
VPLPATLKLREETDRQLRQDEEYWGTVWNYMVSSDDIDGSFAQWYPVVQQYTQARHEFFAAMGREYLADLDLKDVRTIPPFEMQRFAASMHAMGVASFKGAIARGESPARAMALARSLTWGSYSRFLMDSQRQVIMDGAVQDPNVRGWRRVGFGGCDFCDMLISRGAVYTQATAFFASHDRCRCGAEPDNDTSPFIKRAVEAAAPGRAIAVEPAKPTLPDLGFPPIQGEHSWMDDADNVNPNYPDRGYTDNCWGCTHAYELRRRGYEVEALDSDRLPSNTSITEYEYSWLPPALGQPRRRFRKIGTRLLNEPVAVLAKMTEDWPDGARGAISTSWKTGGAHILNWEKIDGEVKLIDSQVQTVDDIEDLVRRSKPGQIWFIRTDDLEADLQVRNRVRVGESAGTGP